MSPSKAPLSEHARLYGCPELLPLDQPRPEHRHLDYLDLIAHKSAPALPLAAVAEHQGTALLYLVDRRAEQRVNPSDLSNLQRSLANRSDPAWIGIVRPGSLEIFPIGFRARAGKAIRVVRENDACAPFLFQGIVHGQLKSPVTGTDYVYNRILDLLIHTTEELVDKDIPPLVVLSLAGRALFFRFLVDRGIVLPSERNEICPYADDLKGAFSDPRSAAHTSAWLDATFNGDFLPLIEDSISSVDARHQAYLRLYNKLAKQTSGRAFDHLQAILRGWKHCGNDTFQLELDWGDLDFAHIPVGVLSQVYESFSHKVDARHARKTSVHYTPRTIARLMVDETFSACSDPAGARVLDPACGAGIFLALALRRLVRERWKKDGRRPSAATIRSLLYDQLRGFDIQESALRLAALTLYITAIEVDGSPRPPKALKFPRPLRGAVLFDVGAADAPTVHTPDAFRLGSLEARWVAGFRNQFDIVIGNPPWTRLREDKPQRSVGGSRRAPSDDVNEDFTRIGREALRERGLGDVAESYKNPDKDPDIPFVWRATQWAKPNGLISFALPARVFQRTTGAGSVAWRAIVHAMTVTGLINGSDLRWTAVWKNVKVPFCLFFARNSLPSENHRFVFAAPSFESGINHGGLFRIDYAAIRTVSVREIEREPWILKALSLGTRLDVDVIGRLRSSRHTLADLWKTWDPQLVRTGQGYNLSSSLVQRGAEFLADLRDFVEPSGFSFRHHDLQTFAKTHGARTAHRPRRMELYEPPVVIVPQAPGADPSGPRAWLSELPVAFSQSFYGYSCAGHPESDTLAALLVLLPHSTLVEYFCLMTSRRAGADRQTFNKEEFDAIPFPDPTELDEATKSALRQAALALSRGSLKVPADVDRVLFEVYGVDNETEAVMRDTLFAAMSYRQAGRIALEPTTEAQRHSFGQALTGILQPFFEVCGHRASFDLPRSTNARPGQPWSFVALTRDDSIFKLDQELLSVAMRQADEQGATRVIVRAGREPALLLGSLNQRRWWTSSRAKLCAQDIVREHLDAFQLDQVE